MLQCPVQGIFMVLLLLSVLIQSSLTSMYHAMIPPGETVNSFKHPPCIVIDAITSLFNCDALWCISLSLIFLCMPQLIGAPLFRSILSQFKWGGSASYCNLSILPCPALRSDGRKVTYNSQTTVAMTVGAVTKCSLYNIMQQGGYKSEVHISGGRMYHSICIMPFSQLWWRKSMMLGLLFYLFD